MGSCVRWFLNVSDSRGRGLERLPLYFRGVRSISRYIMSIWTISESAHLLRQVAIKFFKYFEIDLCDWLYCSALVLSLRTASEIGGVHDLKWIMIKSQRKSFAGNSTQLTHRYIISITENKHQMDLNFPCLREYKRKDYRFHEAELLKVLKCATDLSYVKDLAKRLINLR